MATVTETELEPGEKPPETAPLTVAETPKPAPDPLTGVVQARLESGRRERDLYLEREAATAPAREALLTETQRERPAVPGAPTLPPVPTQQRRPFLEGPGTETPQQTLQRFVAGLTTFASVVGGIAAGDAKFALSGLTGAIQGWQAGDQKRLDDEWKQWDAATTRMLRQYEMQRKQYDDVIKDMSLGLDQKARALQVISLTNGDALMAEKATQGNLDVVIKHMEVQAKQAADLAYKQMHLNMQKYMADTRADLGERQLAEATRHHGATEEQAAKKAAADKPLGEHAAKWENAAGERPDPRLTMTEAVVQGFRPSSKMSRADAARATGLLLDQVEALIPKLETKGFLSTGPGSGELAMARARRSQWVPAIGKAGDPDLVAWLAHAGTMVSVQRQLGDIGPRAMAAFESAVNVIKEPTSAAGARQAFQNLRDAIAAGQEQRAGSAPQTPAGRRPLPQGAHYEGDEIVSNSGKYIWRNGAWQSRF